MSVLDKLREWLSAKEQELSKPVMYANEEDTFFWLDKHADKLELIKELREAFPELRSDNGEVS